jgi:predicted Ser/Thr protein kinase
MSNKKDIKNLQPITDRFSINENKHLGNGCFGSVYEGYDSKQDKIIAIKHLNRP